MYDKLGLKWKNDGCISNKDFKLESEDIYAYRYYPNFIAAIELVGLKDSSGAYSNLKIIEIFISHSTLSIIAKNEELSCIYYCINKKWRKKYL